ncbi:unnamed protein product, partial [Clonostachys rhizophaga]
MAIIAVTGGTEPIRENIVEGLVQHGSQVFVPSRGYDDIETTAQTLQQAKIDALIFAISVTYDKLQVQEYDGPRMRNSEFRHANGHRHASLTPRVRYALNALEELEKTNLSYTRIVNGLFLDYYGMPHWKTSLHPWLNVLNMEKKWAVIPGDGSARAAFITSQDLGTFIGRLMDLDHWDKVSSIVSNTMTMSELAELAEKRRGNVIGQAASFSQSNTRRRLQV